MKHAPLSFRVTGFGPGDVPCVWLTYDVSDGDDIREIVDHHIRNGHNVGAKMIAPFTLEVRPT